MKKSFIYSFTTLFLLIGCNTTVKNKTIYFGGQIKNPKDDTVYIIKEDSTIASTKLDTAHKFMFKLDSITNGLYQFKHGDEVQYIYLKKKDSLLIRLNTWDFDGSLVFSGKGANRNNFLIQLFLENEQEEREFYKFYKLEENDFNAKIDSVIQVKKIQFKHFKENTVELSDSFTNLVNTSIYFPIYSKKEIYPIQYKRIHQLAKLPQLSANYYLYRQTATTSKNSFKSYYTYKNYLWNKIYNIALYQKEQDTLSELSSILLEQIVKLVSNEKIWQRL